jgi:hypothetical protein
MKSIQVVIPAIALALGCDAAESVPRVDAISVRVHSATELQSDAPAVALSSPRPCPDFERDVAPLIEKYCVSCHDAASARGKLVLENAPGSPSSTRREAPWRLVADVLKNRSMPPEGEPSPHQDELETINLWLDQAVFGEERARAGINVRRLNRAEYNNTIRDLIGLDLRLADDFPSDDAGYGFDNIADVQATPPVLLEMYVAAAERAVAGAFASAEVRERILHPPLDTVPRAFRRYTPPVVARGEKRLFLGHKAVVDPELARQRRIYDILRAFADRAFRRPARHGELMRLLAIAEAAEKDGETSEQGIQLSLQAVLVSPHFLFRIEAASEDEAGGPALPAHDFDLASRLSYFLWSSMPDETLLRLASDGALRRPDVLRTQVVRLMRDSRTRALAENFAGQWLQTRKLAEVAPDPERFPEFDETLRAAMRQETERFFSEIQRQDRSVLEFLDADYTFVNSRLARHYGIPGVEGDHFRRVSLVGTPRGGVLTQGAILAVTSSPTRTSPVRRGKWILENLLGVSPPPPPSGVEALREGQEVGASGTLRQRLEAHRTDPACASCHRRMDPLGFGLENFDAVGRWRTEDEGGPIDASGTLSRSRTFRGPAELRALLLSRRDAFARCLSEKMLTYALGRGLTRADRREVDGIAEALAREGYRFSALVRAVVESRPFLERSQKEEASHE